MDSIMHRFSTYLYLPTLYSMSANRAFPHRTQAISTSGDWTRGIHDFAVYTNIAKNVARGNGPNPAKKSGARYNTYGVSAHGPNTGCLVSAPSQGELLSIIKGKHYANPILAGASESSTSSTAANAIVVDYTTARGEYSNVPATMTYDTDSSGSVTLGVTDGSFGTVLSPAFSVDYYTAAGASYPSDPYPGVLSDPSNQIFWPISGCPERRGYAWSEFARLADVSYQWTPYFWRAVSGHALAGIAVPEKVSFQFQTTDGSSIDQALLPLAAPNTSYDTSAVSRLWCDGRFAMG
jgi:hypothetical protein